MDKSYGELYDEELNAHIEQFEQAIGIMATFKPTMEVDINHPVDMALEVSNHIVGMKQRIAALEARIERERKLSDALYLLLVDNPNTKLLADQILIDINGKLGGGVMQIGTRDEHYWKGGGMMIDFTNTQTVLTHRERAGGAAMVDTDTFISALDALEISQQRIAELEAENDSVKKERNKFRNLLKEITDGMLTDDLDWLIRARKEVE